MQPDCVKDRVERYVAYCWEIVDYRSDLHFKTVSKPFLSRIHINIHDVAN